MPVIVPTETRDRTVGNDVHVVAWTPLANGDSGTPYAMSGFADRWRDHADFPADPWDDRTGTISLIPPDQPRPDTDPIPRYRLREVGFVGPNIFNARDEINYPGWPKHPSNLEAMNISAELVLS